MLNLVPVLFRFINTAIIIGIGYYLFKTRIRGKIDEKITQKEMLLKGLEEQGYFLEGKSQELELQLERQAKKIKKLEQKIEEWHLQVRLEKQKQQQEYQQNHIRLANQISLKNKYLYEKTMQETVMPVVIHDVEQLMYKEFEDPQKMNNYMQAIIDHVGQGK